MTEFLSQKNLKTVVAFSVAMIYAIVWVKSKWQHKCNLNNGIHLASIWLLCALTLFFIFFLLNLHISKLQFKKLFADETERYGESAGLQCRCNVYFAAYNSTTKNVSDCVVFGLTYIYKFIRPSWFPDKRFGNCICFSCWRTSAHYF